MATPSCFDTYEGAAPSVGVSSRTLRRWAKQGRLDVRVTDDGQKLVDVDAALAIAKRPVTDPPSTPREIVSITPLPPADAPRGDPADPVISVTPTPISDPPGAAPGQPVNDDTSHFAVRLADLETAVALLVHLSQDWEERLAAVEQTLADALDPPDEAV